MSELDTCSLNKTDPAKVSSPEELDRLSELFKAFGDITRIRIMEALADREISVGELAEELSMTTSAVSHQLKLLKGVHLIKGRREGKSIYYSLDDDHVKCMLNCGLDHIRE